MELDNCINYLLSVSQNAVFKYFSQQLLVYNITPAQYGVLTCLWKKEIVTPKEIRQSLHLEASTVSTMLDKMQSNGLIERNINLDNRRIILVSLTQKSIDLKSSIEKIVLDMNDHILGEFTHKEKKILTKILLRIIKKHSKNSI